MKCILMNPSPRDVICGRGGATRRHPGNKNYRSLINSNKPTYLLSTKEEKTGISRSIVAAIREQQGQFLEQRGNDQIWYDIGDAKATEKTSQALREGQPKLRQKMIDKGIIKDSYKKLTGVVEVIIALPKPKIPKPPPLAMSFFDPVVKPDDNSWYNNEESVHGNRSNVVDMDCINIISNNNNNNQNQPSLGFSLEHLLQEKNKLTCNSSRSSSNNQYQKRHPHHHPYETLEQQQHLALPPYEKQPDYCEDTSMAHCTTHHHSNRMMKDLEDYSNHSIMTFDVDFDDDDDDDDLFDNDDSPLPLTPNCLPVVSDDRENCSYDDDGTINVVKFINNSCIYDPHIRWEKKRMWEECNSSLEEEQKWQQVQRSNSYNQNNHHHHTNHHHAYHHHFDRHPEHERDHERQHDTQLDSNDFEYEMSDNNGYDDGNNIDEDSGVISLGLLSSVVFPAETHPYLSGQKRHTM